MNILAIDYGTKRIGLAKWSSAVNVVLPYGQAGDVKEVIRLIKDENIDKVVVGMPLGLDGKQNKNTARVEEFISQLQQASGITPVVIDERFSSQQADRMAPGVGRDEKAAMIILQTFLDKHLN